jgi:O-antigen ligase
MTQVFSIQPDSISKSNDRKAETYFLAGIYILIFGTIFPTIRAFLIGHEGSVYAFEYLFSALPDIAIILYTAGTFALRFNQGKTVIPSLLTEDKILIAVGLYAIVIGSFLSADIKFIIYGLRMSYIPILMYVSVRNLFDFINEEVFLKGLSLFMHWIGITSIIGLLLYFPLAELEQKLKIIVHASQSEYHIKRLNSIFHAPTLNGAYMSIAAAYFSIRLINKFSLRLVLLIIPIFICLLLSVSRGGIFAYLIVLVGIILLMRKWKSSLFLLVILGLSVIVGLRAVNLSPEKASWIFKSTAGTMKMEKDQTRVKLWDSSYSTLERHPFGLGLGKSGWIANRFVKESDEETAFSATDGWYLKTASEIGIPGLILFLIFFIYSGLRILMKINIRRPEISFFVLILVAQVLLLNIVSNSLDYFIFNSFFWMCIAMGVSTVIKRDLIK